eukprot:scaffold16342_cov129-Isochrysis_galbana.AAC.2
MGQEASSWRRCNVHMCACSLRNATSCTPDTPALAHAPLQHTISTASYAYQLCTIASSSQRQRQSKARQRQPTGNRCALVLLRADSVAL